MDVGTTTTHHALWRLEPLGASGAGTWGPPRCLHESAIFLTPWREDGTIDGEALQALHRDALDWTGIDLRSVHAAAILVTGLAARAPGIRESLGPLERLVAKTSTVVASPREEALFAGRAAGARADARLRLRTAGAIDVGGGTASLSVFAPDGREWSASVLVGGRMVRVRDGRILSVTDQAKWCAGAAGVSLGIGDPVDPGALGAVCEVAAASCLESLRTDPPSELRDVAWESIPPVPDVVYLAGGVGECAREGGDPFRYGDVGPMLGAALRKALGERLRETLGESRRATVTGLASHRLVLSGNTVTDHRTSGESWVDMPFRRIDARRDVLQALEAASTDPECALGMVLPDLDWQGLVGLAGHVVAVRGMESRLAVVLEADMGKALGMALKAAGHQGPCVILDGIAAPEADRLDILARGGDGAVAVAFRKVEFSSSVP